MPAPLPNEPLDVAGLPRLDDGEFVAVDPRHVLGWIGFLLLAAVAVAVGGVLTSSQTDGGWIAAAGFVVAGVLAIIAILAWLEALRVGHQIREHDVSLRSGIIVRTVETVPFRRVQHVSLTRGPLERALGLATVGVHSAGPDISIPGLTPDDAGALRRLIVTRAGLAEERDSEPGADPDASPLDEPQ